jgi:hypothetical protein
MAGDPAAAAIPSQSSTKPEEERFTLTHNAVLEALGIHNSTPANTQQHQQLQARRTLLVFNLFVLETFSIAEALGIRCAAAHPYLIPYSCPATFQRRFKHTFPAQYAQLTDPCNRDSGAVSWGEVQHWMWPLWTERWSAFREELGLSPSPLEHSTQGSLPKAPPLLYGRWGSSALHAAQQGSAPGPRMSYVLQQDAITTLSQKHSALAYIPQNS